MSLDKKSVELSVDHKPDDEEEKKRIVASGKTVSDGRVDGMLAVSRAFGDFMFKEATNPRENAVSAFPDVTVTPRTDKCEFVVLACDGLWDVKKSSEAVEYFHNQLYDGEYGSRDVNFDEITYFTESLVDSACAEEHKVADSPLGTDNITTLFVELRPKL